MLLESNHKKDDRIRRKSYYADNPVWNAGLRINSVLLQLRMELNYYVVPVKSGIHSYPALRLACTGLSGFKTYGLAFEKRSYK